MHKKSQSFGFSYVLRRQSEVFFKIKYDSQVIICLRILRIDTDHIFIKSCGLSKMIQTEIVVSQVEMSFEKVRIQLQGLQASLNSRLRVSFRLSFFRSP